MAKALFFYLGDDEAYFKTLQSEFNRHTRMPLEFVRIYEKDESKIQSIFIKIFTQKPVCVFIDLSKQTQDYLHLARIIARTPLEHKIVTVGLVDILSPVEVLKESISTGVNLTHIKGPDSFDVVFDVVRLVSPNEMGEHGFANATLKENWEVGIPVKVGFAHAEGIHFETDFKVSSGDRLRINHHWMEKRVVPSREVFVKDVQTSNLFYQYRYGVDVDFLFIDEFLPPEGMEESRIIEKKSERDELIIYHRKQLSRWVDDNLSRSMEKKAKVLVVDKDFHFYQDQPRTDKHPYIIRCVPYIEEISEELERLRPQVIAYAIQNEDEKDRKNTMQNLEMIIQAVKQKFSDINPVFVVFNTDAISKDLQDAHSYPNIMATHNQLAVDLLVRMADIFEKKMGSISEVVVGDIKKSPQKVFIKKTNPSSFSEILIPLTVIKLSESDMIIQSEVELPIGMNLHFTKPVEMFVNVQPSKNQSKVPEYHGLIHCLGESQKKDLRRFVNSVFFRDHDAQVNAETEEFKKLNEAKLLEKQEELKRQEEESENENDSTEKAPKKSEP